MRRIKVLITLAMHGVLIASALASTSLVREYVQMEGTPNCVREISLPMGVKYVTSTAPTFPGYIFSHWAMTAEGVTRDLWGRAHDAVSCRIEGNVDFTAHYLPEGQDSDEDGVPDGYEIYWYGDLTQGAGSDTDGDGFTFVDELANGTNPLMADSDDEGPVQYDDGRSVTYNPSDYKSVMIVTDVDGVRVTSSCEWLRPGTVVETPAQAQTFAYWVRNGVQCRDELGRAVDQIGFTMGSEPETLVAVQITDASTRQKLYWYGETDVSMDSDTDGDGRTFAEEIVAGTNPLMAEEDVDGAIQYDDGMIATYSYDGPRYEISFDSNGGMTSPSSISYRKGAVYGELPSVERDGYKLLGWFTEVSGGTQVRANMVVEKSQTLYAHWVDASYFIIDFVVAGAEMYPEAMAVLGGDGYGALPVVARPEYRFLGWYLSEDDGSPITKDTVAKGDCVLYAHWERVQYRIAFDVNGGTPSQSAVLVECGAGYGNLPVITRRGSKFLGWFTSTSGGMQVTADSVADASRTLYAHWDEVRYLISFNSNGGTTTPPAVSLQGEFEYGKLPVVTRKGYRFVGWFTAADGGTQITEESIVEVACTLYAHWAENRRTISFDTGCDVVVPDSTQLDGFAYGVLPVLTREGFDFLGWFTEPAGGSRVTENVEVTSDCVWYAHWRQHYASEWIKNCQVDVFSGARRVGIAQNLIVNPQWVSGGTKAIISVDGVPYREATSAGECTWAGAQTKEYTLTHQVVDASGAAIGEPYVAMFNWVNRVTITFEAGNGEEPSPRSYDEAFAYGELPTVSRIGYAFDGWYTAAEGGTKVVAADTVLSATTLYGHWINNTYFVRFISGDGEGTMANQSFKYDVPQTLLANQYVRMGYAFSGWLYTNGVEDVVFANQEVVSNLTVEADAVVDLSAVWSANSYSVKFNANGGSGSMANEPMAYDTENTLTACAFTKPGYAFAGWATSANGEVVYANGQEVKNLAVVQDAVVNLYAKWTADAYSVAFSANGGTGTMANEPMTYDAEKALTACAFTRKGYTFAGWAMSSVGAVKYANGATVKNLATSGSVTLYAKWTPNNYVIDFNPGQGGTGTMSDQPMTYDEAAALYANLFMRTGYTFLGWTDDPNEVEEALYCDGAIVENLTDEEDGEFGLYAIWTANEYTVRFNANGGTGTMADQAFLYDEEQALRANGFARTGYTFAGWNGNSGGAAKQFAEGEIVSNLTSAADGVVTMSAVWTANPYTVRFDANGGEGTMSDLNCTYGTAKALTACAFARTGYAFAGWATSAGGAVMYADRASVTDAAASGTVTFYAKWTPFSYSVKFNANGGSGTMANESMAYNSAKALTACAFAKTGYTFAGWATSADGEVVYGNGQSVKNLTATQDAVVNLYAKWTANAYSVRFDANGGSGTMANGSMTYDAEKVLTACAFTRTGYTFAGWATSADGAVKYADGATAKNLAASGTVTLYAKWNPIAYSVKFDANGGSGSMANETMTYDSWAALTANGFAKTGYAFTGWATSEDGAVVYADGQSVKNLTVEAGGVVNLYAVWEVNSYALTVKPNSTKYGSVSGSGAYDYGTKVTLKANAKSGYVFAGWYTDKACTKELGPEGYDNRKSTVKYAMPAKKTTVYAKFISKSSDKKALTFSDATQRLATSAKSYTAGKTMSLGLGFTAKSLPKVTAKDLPDGMEIDPVTGKITGKPTEPGKYAVTVTVKTAAGNKISQKVKIYVTVPSGYYGTFDGYALVKTTPAYITFTSDKYGAVSGKVTYKGKGYKFTASYSETSSTKSKFTPSIKIGSSTYKPTVTIEKVADGITVSEVRGEQEGKFVFVAQKKPSLIKAKKTLAGMVGKSYTFNKGYKNAGLTKSGDKLKVKFGETDAVKVSGQAKGRKVSFSTSVIYGGMEPDAAGDVYTAMVILVDSTAKYYKRLVFTITVDPATKKIVKVAKAFGEIE